MSTPKPGIKSSAAAAVAGRDPTPPECIDMIPKGGPPPLHTSQTTYCACSNRGRHCAHSNRGRHCACAMCGWHSPSLRRCLWTQLQQLLTAVRQTEPIIRQPLPVGPSHSKFLQQGTQELRPVSRHAAPSLASPSGNSFTGLSPVYACRHAGPSPLGNPPPPLKIFGSRLVTGKGKDVTLKGINWFGFNVSSRRSQQQGGFGCRC